jgi:hypothetical protein
MLPSSSSNHPLYTDEQLVLSLRTVTVSMQSRNNSFGVTVGLLGTDYHVIVTSPSGGIQDWARQSGLTEDIANPFRFVCVRALRI